MAQKINETAEAVRQIKADTRRARHAAEFAAQQDARGFDRHEKIAALGLAVAMLALQAHAAGAF